jgi:Domain of unknown function (DUF4382)/Carboxypeptidase regulatory-like domain
MNGNIRAAFGFSAAALLCSFGLAGCGSAGGSGSSSTGTMAVAMADAPLDADHVNVWISKVEASGPGGWHTLRNTTAPTTPIDLKTLVVNDMDLAGASLPAGHYNQLRLIVTKAEVVKGSSTYPVEIPSGMQTGIKLNINADVPPNAVTQILLDFNAAQSIHATPPGSTNYKLQPVIPAVLKVLSGTITGTVTLDGTNPAPNAAVAVYPAGTGMQAGTEVNTSQTLADGTFKVWALLAGSYDVKITSADTTQTKTVLGVQVVANQNTPLDPVSLAP